MMIKTLLVNSVGESGHCSIQWFPDFIGSEHKLTTRHWEIFKSTQVSDAGRPHDQP